MSGAIAIWLCNGLVTCLIFARLGLRKWRRFKFTMGDWCLVVALVFNGLRVVGDYYTNKYGTPLNTSVRRVIAPAAEDESTGLELTTEEQNDLVLAGKLAIASRVAIVVVSYDRLWIITYELSNIITDTMLFFQPILLILGAPISKWERAWLSLFGLGAVLVFGLGALLIAVEVIRLVEGLPFTNVILNRIVWGSIEVIIAASVATLPSIYILMRLGFGKRQQEDWDKTQGESGELVVADIDIWDGNMPARRKRPPDTVHLGVGRSSRISSRLRGADGDLRDTLSGWIELEEVDIESAAEVPSPEPDDAEQRGGGIFIATEINQETHQAWESDERPRIVTIPRRAKLDGALV
ncbi:hypothetical protein EKO27_g1304 [Xylaria grammica]|uniref:Integral membrane protein n=1 Tax=Xylaria grammica TaxID=363999 RepID=A0A439DHC3_9PEZI|nr:hypothetical protein EKO27_g1304 [Xylaria grammica]